MTSYLQRIPSGFYFRFSIPIAVRSQVGARELRIPLGTHSRAEALQASALLGYATSRVLAAIKKDGVRYGIDEVRAQVLQFQSAATQFHPAKIEGFKVSPRLPLQHATSARRISCRHERE